MNEVTPGNCDDVTLKRGSRLYYLDNLRFSLTMLVICHHVNAAYGSIGGWGYIEREPSGVVAEVLATAFAAITQAFFMSSFFLISAYFSAPEFDRKGPWKFLWRRLIRLGIPLVVYYYVLSLLLRYMTLCFKGRMDEGFIEFFTSNFGVYTSPGPLWFACTLLIFEGVYLVVRLISSRCKRKPVQWPMPGNLQVLLFILGVGVFTFLFRQWQPLTKSVYHFRLGFFPLYVCMFTFGIVGYRSGWFEKLPVKQANLWFRVALFAIAIMPAFYFLNEYLGNNTYKFWEGFSWQCYGYAAWEPFLCVGINMKLIVLYRDRFNTATSLTKRLAASSYTAYITHAFFIAVPTYLFTAFSLGRIPEIILMWPVAVIPCFLFADVVRRLPLLRRVL